MDWQGTSDEADKTVEIAVVKLAATVPVTDSRYGGAIVMNPGGPGGSGVWQVLKGGHSLRTLLSAGPEANQSTAKQFDIIGFDPRGVNNTSPYYTCFPDHHAAAKFELEKWSHGWVDSYPSSFDHLWATNRALARGCSERAAKEGIAKHMTTATVARDIVEIFERHGQWRENEAQRLLASPENAFLSPEEKIIISDATAYDAGNEMVQYWGFSYGSLLGGTLTAMFPERIKRVVLDGVLDFPNYMAAGWSTHLRDVDRQLEHFGESCFAGGPEHCAVYDAAGPSAILANVQNTLSDFRSNPISIAGDANQGPTIVTYNDLQLLLFRKLAHTPVADFPEIAQTLAELRHGNGTTLARLKRARPELTPPPISAQCEHDGPYSPACIEPTLHLGLGTSTTHGIACSDGDSRTADTKASYRTYADAIVAQSTLIGGWWAAAMIPCTAWTPRPHWRYGGDFVTSPAHPVLFVGNTVDPVTPLHNALAMARRSTGAGVLHVDAGGHCSNTTPSMCAVRAIRKYFQSGELPGTHGGVEGWEGKGLRCQPDLVPFRGYHRSSPMPAMPEGETDEALWEALVQLNRAWL